MSLEKNGDSGCTVDRIGIHAVDRATRFEVLELVRLGARVTAIELHADHADVDATLAQAAGRSLVLVVKNLHRHRWMALAVDAALARRPDAIVVEMGLPACRPAGATAYVATHGAARVCGVAAAEVLMATSVN